MPEIPDCLARRYRALDELIRELTSSRSGSNIECCSDDPGVKMMCNFWSILKENPDCDLKKAVEERMGLTSKCTDDFQPKRCRDVTCYMAGCCKRDGDKSKESEVPKSGSFCKPGQSAEPTSCQRCNSPSSSSDIPLSKVLCNIKEAASFDKKCQAKVSELLSTQIELQEQIGSLEQREKEGLQLLKQADCMWTCMEASYKKNVAESLERQKTLLTQMKEIEGSVQKWRKNKKELEFQMGNVTKCQQEIKEKSNEKKNDLKCINLEITDFKKRTENNNGDIEATNRSFSSKKNASSAKQNYNANQVSKLQNLITEEKNRKTAKENEGIKYIKDAREDLQKLCKVLLQKKLENEDMNAEKEALLLEIEMLNQTCDQCKDKCRNKQQNIEDEIRAIDKETANFQVRCIRCHECTDTTDMRKFCTDCPRCADERNCLLEGDHCSPDHSVDCVCMTVKRKFLDNVFENMYTVLERQTRTDLGKAVSDAVLNCLQKSRNGKLNEATRKILQDFILNTVKKNLNLTIVGGAVKTRCEMDPDTYSQLMLCLKQIKVTKPPKVDKAVPTKKDPCQRWPTSSECNCPNGPKDCICTKRAPPSAKDPAPYAPDEDDEENPGEEVVCPHRDNTLCGPECGARTPSRVATDVAAWKRSPCQGATCQLRNMRAAQCVLGPEALCSKANLRNLTKPAPISPSAQSLGKYCQCRHISTKPCACHKDVRDGPREKIIEEVMGRYTEVTSIEKVSQLFCTPILHLDTKQLKVKKNDICNKEISTTLQFPFSNKKIMFSDDDVVYEIEHIVSKEGLAKSKSDSSNVLTKKRSVNIIEKYPIKKENEKQSKTRKYGNPVASDIDVKISNKQNNINIVVSKSDNELECVASKLNKTPSGNLAMTLEKSVIKLIDSKAKETGEIYINLKEDESGSYSIDFSCSDLDKNAKMVLVKRTASGNLLLDITQKKKLPSVKSKKTLKTKSCKKMFKSKKLQKTPPKEVIDCCTETSDVYKSDLCKATIKGLKKDIKEPVILRQTASGNYDIIIDKEFENWYKEAVKCHEGEEEVTCVKIRKSRSGDCVISFNENEDCEYKNAYLSKSENGNFKLIINMNVVNPLLQKNSSIISSKVFEKLLNHEPETLKNERKIIKKKSLQYKSCSDSNIYNDLRKNLSLQFSSLTSAKLTKTNSGQYTVVLDKESRNSFVMNLRKYLCGSTKGFIPIKRGENGELSIALNNVLNKVEYASLTISPSGSIYVTAKDFKIDKIDISTELSSHCNLKWDRFIDDIENPSAKGISTRCNATNDVFCDMNKCVCKNLRYQSNRWLVDPDTSNGECGVVWRRDTSGFSDLHSRQCNGSNINPHIVIRPREEEKPRNDVYEHYNCFTNGNICPYHVSRYKKLSNDLIEISGCPTGRFRERNSDIEVTQTEQMDILNRIQRQNKYVSSGSKECNWDSVQYLPHQLPPFLKDFSFAI